jgi:hypothetical protein
MHLLHLQEVLARHQLESDPVLREAAAELEKTPDLLI